MAPGGGWLETGRRRAFNFSSVSQEMESATLTAPKPDNCESCAWTSQAANVMQQLNDLRTGQQRMGDRFDSHAAETRRALTEISTAIASQVDSSSIRAHQRIDAVAGDVVTVRSEIAEAKGKLVALTGLIGTIVSALVSWLSHLIGGGTPPAAGN